MQARVVDPTASSPSMRWASVWRGKQLLQPERVDDGDFDEAPDLLMFTGPSTS